MYNRQDLIQNAKKKNPTEHLIIYVTRNTQTYMKKILKIFYSMGKLQRRHGYYKDIHSLSQSIDFVHSQKSIWFGVEKKFQKYSNFFF